MTRTSMRRLLGLAALLWCAATLTAQPTADYKSRRLKAWAVMKPNSVMIVRSRGSFGTFHAEPQDGSFLYLTGIDEPGAFLVLQKRQRPDLMPGVVPGMIPPPAKSADPETGKAILFIQPRDDRRADWDALPLGIDGAKALGFPDVRPSADFEAYFDQLLLFPMDVLYVDLERSRKVSAPFTSDEQVLARARDKGAKFELASPAEVLPPVAKARDASEIFLLRQAVDITAEAQVAAMQALKPRMIEYQLQAVVEYVFSLNGARQIGFPCIIGSGKNSCILHWMLNTKPMQEGEVVVVDIGAEVDSYSADITRTLPVSGKFTARQRQVYEIVLAANKAAIDMVAPGADFAEISKKAAEVVGEGLVKMGLIKDKSEYRKYFFHGLGHTIGLSVGRGGGGLSKLEPGTVLTIEPGIYIREEGLGVRIEDDVLVTVTGVDVLTACPRALKVIGG
jgi:Xaa-Pro aminopeptidase